VRVAALKGPTAIGLASFINLAKTDPASLQNNYDFSISGSADQVLPQLIQGQTDIALVPANAAATLYNKTQGQVVALDVNTLGVLEVVSGDDSIKSWSDLSGMTIYMTGKDSTPEYTVRYLLKQAGLANKVSLTFASEPTEAVARLEKDDNAVAILPEPYATSLISQDPAFHKVLDLNTVWQQYAPAGSEITTGVTVVRTAFLKANPGAVTEFLQQQTASVKASEADTAEYAQYVVDAGIVDDPKIAQAAIPDCGLTCLTGADMEAALGLYLKVLYAANPTSLGGKLPDAAFYYGAGTSAS
jgi:NitT/TauT family transport system substrate-binding protein